MCPSWYPPRNIIRTELTGILQALRLAGSSMNTDAAYNLKIFLVGIGRWVSCEKLIPLLALEFFNSLELFGCMFRTKPNKIFRMNMEEIFIATLKILEFNLSFSKNIC